VVVAVLPVPALKLTGAPSASFRELHGAGTALSQSKNWTVPEGLPWVAVPFTVARAVSVWPNNRLEALDPAIVDVAVRGMRKHPSVLSKLAL
jgi:hypothetical protein